MNLNQDAKPENAFYCADGAVLKNLRELAEKLKNISADAYKHHANEYKNDFHNWIKDVYCSERLAKKIAHAKSNSGAAAIIEKALAQKAPRKKKAAGRKKVAFFKKKHSRQRRKPAKKMKKAASAASESKKKEKIKPAEKAKKSRKRKRKPVKRKTALHKMVRSHLKRLARQFGFW